MPEYLSVAEVAQILKVNPKTIRNWVDEGRLKGRRFGKLIRISSADLAEFQGDSTTVNEQAEPGRPEVDLNAVLEMQFYAERVAQFLKELASTMQRERRIARSAR